MIRKGDYIYLHTLYGVDEMRGLRKGLYTVNEVCGIDVRIKTNPRNSIFLLKCQFNKVVRNKINELLYKELNETY